MKEFQKNVVAKKFEGMKTDNTFDASKNNWNTTNKFQTDASGNNGITFNSGIQKQLNRLPDPLNKFWLKYKPLLLRKNSRRQAPNNAQRKPHPQTPVHRNEHPPGHQILKPTKDHNPLPGTRRGGRTLTPLQESDFESDASADSAIRAQTETVPC